MHDPSRREPFQHTPWGFDIKLLKKDS